MTTRRNFLAANLIGAAGLAANPGQMFSASADSDSAPATSHQSRSDRDFWNDWPAYLTEEMNQARNSRLAELAAINSVAKVQERATMIRSRLWELIGGPFEKTPLNPRVTGIMERDQYRIENIIFESLPKVYVTANLYIPTAMKPPYPAILAPVGHSENGKAYRNYQYLYQNLARKGYVVLAYDPFGQGERLQYIDPQTGRSLYGPTGEHDQAGRPMVLLGETFALYGAWDGIRGLDYLVSRSEVNASRLGCVGHSGGGTMTMYLAALEPRLRAAVVVEGNSENIAGPFFDPPGAIADSEQNIVGGLPFSVDRGDLLWAFSPKPLLICYTTHDVGETYSPEYEESTKNIYQELQRVYDLFGAKDHVGLYASHLPHNMDFFNRTQTYGWLNRWLENPSVGSQEAEFDAFPEERLNATSTGQVLTSLSGRSVIQLNTDRARMIMQKSSFRNIPENIGSSKQKIQVAVMKLLALPQQRLPLDSIIRSSNVCKNVVIEEIQFKSEPCIRIPGWFVKPSSGGTQRSTVLYLTDSGGDSVVAEPGSMGRLLAAGHAICTINLRGLGITTPRFPKGGPHFYDGGRDLDENFAWTSLILGRPVIGQRVWDTLRAIDYLASRPDVDMSQVRLLGAGSAGLAAIMAALLDGRVRTVLVNQTLVSYASIVESKSYSVNLGWFVPGILQNFDVADLAVGLSPRPCWIMNGSGPSGQILSEASVREQYRTRFDETISAFNNVRFLVSPEHEAQEHYLEWLRST
jgi:cephalosporin-C deacetylase-like acetyl esterase